MGPRAFTADQVTFTTGRVAFMTTQVRGRDTNQGARR